VDGTACLTLDLKMYVGAEEPRDTVEVEGEPPIDLTVEGGIFGDTATVGMLVNVAPLLSEVTAGLKTMKDLPVPRAFGTRPDLS
jgi:4-hydroxy-tetrahydrodipicolinate reductase